jgi:hypothetical protein
MLGAQLSSALQFALVVHALAPVLSFAEEKHSPTVVSQ